MKIKIKNMISYFILGLAFISINSQAGVVLNGTRLIFDGNKKEMTMTINNPDNKPYLVQSWVSQNDKKSSEFIVTPPLFKMNAHSTNTLRIVHKLNNLSTEKESLFWLNVKAIPPSDPNAKDSLLIALNTRIKLIYRPTNLINDNASKAYQKLIFKMDPKKGVLVASNPTPYYINLSKLSVNGSTISSPGMVAPYSDATWKVKSSGHAKVDWIAINDFGGLTQQKSAIAQ